MRTLENRFSDSFCSEKNVSALQRQLSWIGRYFQNIYSEGELTRQATVQDFLTVRSEGLS